MIVADFRREYGYEPPEIAAMPRTWFTWYLAGLSDQSRWRRWASDQPVRISGADAVAAQLDRM